MYSTSNSINRSVRTRISSQNSSTSKYKKGGKTFSSSRSINRQVRTKLSKQNASTKKYRKGKKNYSQSLRQNRTIRTAISKTNSSTKRYTGKKGRSYSHSFTTNRSVRTPIANSNYSTRRVSRDGRVYSRSNIDHKGLKTFNPFMHSNYRIEKRKPEFGLFGRKLWGTSMKEKRKNKKTKI